MASSQIKSLDIPKEEQGTLANILKLTGPMLDGLEQALSEVVPTLDAENLISQLRREQSLADIPDLEEIISSLLSIAGTGYSAGVSTDEILDAVIASIKDDDVVDLSEPDAEILKGRLARLAKSKSIELLAKATELLQANERTFLSARIVSDLRMVCTGDDATVAAAVIVHQLAITANRNRRRETTHIVLDSLDLEGLKAVVARAEKKDKALREYANASGTPILSPERE